MENRYEISIWERGGDAEVEGEGEINTIYLITPYIWSYAAQDDNATLYDHRLFHKKLRARWGKSPFKLW